MLSVSVKNKTRGRKGLDALTGKGRGREENVSLYSGEKEGVLTRFSQGVQTLRGGKVNGWYGEKKERKKGNPPEGKRKRVRSVVLEGKKSLGEKRQAETIITARGKERGKNKTSRLRTNSWRGGGCPQCIRGGKTSRKETFQKGEWKIHVDLRSWRESEYSLICRGGRIEERGGGGRARILPLRAIKKAT